MQKCKINNPKPFQNQITFLSDDHYIYNFCIFIMPPKKDGKKEAQSKPDNSGIPKQDIEFKFTFTIKSDAPQPPSLALMFEWFGILSDKLQRYESGLIQGWKKQENNYTFEKECDPLRIDDDFCKTVCNKQFYLYFVNAEDSKVQDSLVIDYSGLLTSQQFTFQSSIIRALGVDSFTIKLTADKPLLGEVYRHYLNPLQVEVIGAKDLPVEKSSRFEPAYVRYTLFDGTPVQTHSLVGNDRLIWSHRHVFLLGLMDANSLKQKMRSRYLKFQLHDRDQINNRKIRPDVQLLDVTKVIQEELEKEKPVQQDPKKKGAAKKEQKKEVKKQTKKDPKKKDAKLGQPILPPKNEILKNNYGVSAFSLVQFLKPSMRTARYKVAVVPKNAFEDFQSKNIDLNTTARNEMQKVLASSNYFDCDTEMVVGFTLAHPIGTFVRPEIKQQVIEDPKKKKEPTKDVKIQQPVKQEKEPVKQENVFERVVYIFPYKDSSSLVKVEEIFYQANLKAFGLKNKRQLTTHLLKQEQKDSKKLDFLTGLQIVDPQGRILIFQGLRGGAIQNFYKVITKDRPNSKDFKILKNSTLAFSQRLFADFQLQLKRIRLRPSLSQLLLQPSIYIKSKVAQQICQNLNKLVQIRKVCDDLASVDALNLWPSAQWLVQIQRKFSQSLSQQDLTGEQQPQYQAVGKSTTEFSKTIRLLQHTDLKVVTADQFFLPKIHQDNSTPPKQQMNETKKRTVMSKTFTKDADKLMDTYQMRGKATNIPQNEQVYIYAGQKNNFYEKQMRQLREQMIRNPKIIYTYDKDHFRLAIDPINLQDYAKKQHQFNQSLMYSKDKFSSLLIKTKDERMRLPKKPGDEDIKNLIDYPYHQQKSREKDLKKNVRDLPLGNGNADFKKYIKKQEIFSQYPVMDGQKISPVEKELLQKEERIKKNQQEKGKMKGDSVIKIKKGYFGDKSTGADRFKDIRQGEAKKLGIIDVKKRSKEKQPIHQYQVSYNLKEQTIDPSFNPLIRRDDPSLNIQKDEFNFYQRPQVLTKTQIYKPLKDII